MRLIASLTLDWYGLVIFRASSISGAMRERFGAPPARHLEAQGRVSPCDAWRTPVGAGAGRYLRVLRHNG